MKRMSGERCELMVKLSPYGQPDVIGSNIFEEFLISFNADQKRVSFNIPA